MRTRPGEVVIVVTSMLKLCSMYVTEVVSRTVLVTNENPAQKQRVLVGTSVGIKQRFEPGDPEITSSCEDFWRARGRGWCYIEGQGEEKGRGEACPTSLQAWNESAPTTVPVTIAGATPYICPTTATADRAVQSQYQLIILWLSSP